ncbi:MAG: DUF349 domain-containing protein [Oleiphilaceae bacterium]|nr:DUF349 domain-containing protein [Oleiphilaceae bacterium]
MATFLSKLFKPKWQNKHLPTRIEAIQALNENSDEDQQVLQELASNDPHHQARSAAISKITNSQFLITLHGKTEADDLKRSIESRLQQLANAQSLTLFDLILDANLLAEMIIKSEQPDVFINGLAHIESPEALLQIAQQSKTSRMRQAAAELLETEQHLSSLVNAAKSKDKSVYQIAKQKLNRIRNELKQREMHQEAVEKILSELQDLSQTDNLQLYDAKLENLTQRWDQHKSEASEADQARFNTLSEQCKQRSQQLKHEQEQAEEAERLARAGGDEQAATLLLLQDTLERFQQQVAAPQDTSALDALIKTQETRWLEATRHSQVEKARAKQYENMMRTLRHYLQALRSLNEHQPALLQSIEQFGQARDDASVLASCTKQIKDCLQQIDWPSQFAQPDVIERAHKTLGKSDDLKQALAENAKKLQSEIHTLLADLDKELEDKQVKASAKLVKTIQNKLSKLDGRRAEKFQPQLSLYIKQLNELRDWQSFAASPRQEALCLEMERLADTALEPQVKADKIRAMQKEWKTLGGANDETLWQRFKSAADRAYEPCQVYFEEQKRLKANNLERRQTIIEQLDTFLTENDWDHADWRAADKINQRARQEWKAAFPVDYKSNKPLQQQFNALLKTLDGHLDAERNRNHERKEAIATQAEALIEQEDLNAAIQSAKELQKQWQQVGITAHKVDRALWKRFRTACDAIFARRDQARNEREEALGANLEAAEDLIKQAEASLTEHAKDLNALKKYQSECRQQFKQLQQVPKQHQAELNERFQKLMDTYSATIRGLQNEQLKLGWEHTATIAEMCRNVYLQHQTGAVDREQLEAAEQRIQSSTEYLDPTLAEAMRSLWIGVKANSLPKASIIDAADARELCIRAEVAAGIDSPESDKELRMQLQVSRLSEGLSNKAKHGTREEQLQTVLHDWYQKVGPTQSEYEALELRIQRCVATLFG